MSGANDGSATHRLVYGRRTGNRAAAAIQEKTKLRPAKPMQMPTKRHMKSSIGSIVSHEK
jgi:hypothetical protein